MQRCNWPGTDKMMVEYHDKEWGTPLHEDSALFEFLCLEGAQAGLTWRTILYRRDGYRATFDHFDPKKIARYGDEKVEKLLQDTRIIRNRLKIHAFIENAKTFLKIQEEFGSFDSYIWAFVDNKTINNYIKNSSDRPSQTKTSVAMAKDLKKRGFKFVGPTICYAFMQATGMVNDHLVKCSKWEELS